MRGSLEPGPTQKELLREVVGAIPGRGHDIGKGLRQERARARWTLEREWGWG